MSLPKGSEAHSGRPAYHDLASFISCSSMYGNSGVACTTLLVKEKFSWSMLKRDVREYVLSCGCRRRKRANSRKRQADKDRQRGAANAGVERVFPSSRDQVGDFVVVRVSASTLNTQGTHQKHCCDTFFTTRLQTNLHVWTLQFM